MKVGLGIESDAAIQHLMPAVRGVDNALEACFANEQYGTDLLHIAIGVILVDNSATAKRFHPVRPFKYKRLDRVKHPGTGQIMEFRNTATWDVKPDFGTFSGKTLGSVNNQASQT